ncbi:MAG: hypothetical protein K2M94_05955 [Paramuribaculum sp.]|nr:hypothetical protein [Paramuribaculum sp.]
MNENTLSQMAYNLLDAATALAGIIDQPLKGNCVTVNYQYASELIRNVQMSARSAASELMFINDEKGGAE